MRRRFARPGLEGDPADGVAHPHDRSAGGGGGVQIADFTARWATDLDLLERVSAGAIRPTPIALGSFTGSSSVPSSRRRLNRRLARRRRCRTRSYSATSASQLRGASTRRSERSACSPTILVFAGAVVRSETGDYSLGSGSASSSSATSTPPIPPPRPPDLERVGSTSALPTVGERSRWETDPGQRLPPSHPRLRRSDRRPHRPPRDHRTEVPTGALPAA